MCTDVMVQKIEALKFNMLHLGPAHGLALWRRKIRGLSRAWDGTGARPRLRSVASRLGVGAPRAAPCPGPVIRVVRAGPYPPNFFFKFNF